MKQAMFQLRVFRIPRSIYRAAYVVCTMYAPTFHDLSLTQFKSVSNTRFLIDAQFVAKTVLSFFKNLNMKDHILSF